MLKLCLVVTMFSLTIKNCKLCKLIVDYKFEQVFQLWGKCILAKVIAFLKIAFLKKSFRKIISRMTTPILGCNISTQKVRRVSLVDFKFTELRGSSVQVICNA